ncbi:MAG: uroporphyrinogen decarboxylase family protein [Planctomycetota bacterium]|jgi:uroporphyrinogen decarboxylase|nr:uroporphyrinogen decarboxylase family protein [Planctomycetota bacterium]
MNSRERVNAAVAHRAPDRLPVDFLATPEIWRRLEAHFGLAPAALSDDQYFDPVREDILRRLEIDCRVLSYDQFCAPPLDKLPYSGRVEWWDVGSRSTPSRMWRLRTGEGTARDVFGRIFKTQNTGTAVYEESVPVLREAESVADLEKHPWPAASWFDFSRLREEAEKLHAGGQKHLRYRIGSVFELAWQLRGMDQFMMDLALDPDIPAFIMGRIAEVLAETADRALAAAGDAVDMVYFYDDVASNAGMMISAEMWEEFIRPHHQRLIDVARKRGKQVMYHSDGAMREIVEPLIEMGIDVLNPIQPNTAGMDPASLKRDYGARLAFHGGVDIVDLLPKSGADDVREAIRTLSGILGRDGGYVMASAHHIQPDTPLANVLAMYEFGLRWH